MSLTAFLQQYVKPTRWWRRKRSIEITLWPRFLAQALCPHSPKQYFSEDKTIWRCDDCFLFNFPQGVNQNITANDSAARDH